MCDVLLVVLLLLFSNPDPQAERWRESSRDETSQSQPAILPHVTRHQGLELQPGQSTSL